MANLRENTASAGTTYTGADIEVLEGLLGAYSRPGMYIGDTGKTGFHHLLWEVVNNSLDEAIANYCDHITVTMNPDNSVTVEDDGRGIPIDLKQLKNGKKVPTVEVLLTHLHSGAKFSSDAYKYSGGLHGVGISVVNALSDFVEVEITRDRAVHSIKFAFQESIQNVNGVEKSVPEPGVCVEPLKKIGTAKKDETGTKVTFRPNSRGVFEVSKWDVDLIKERLKLFAHVVPGVQISFIDHRNEDQDAEKIDYLFENGLNDLIDEISEEVAGYEEDGEIYFDVVLENGNLEVNSPILDKSADDGSQEEIGQLEFYAQWVEDRSSTVKSIVNAIPTSQGGTHVSAVQSAMVRTVNRIAKESQLLEEKERVKWEDVSHGIVAVINVYLLNPEFEGQVKGKLGGGLETSQVIQHAANRALSQWAMEHPAEMRDIAERSVKEMQIREHRAEEDRNREKEENRGSEPSKTISPKLKDCRNHDGNSELVIVEGDSAGDSVYLECDEDYQAMLPLKGKILNLILRKLDVDSNGVVHIPLGVVSDIVNSLGCGTEERFDKSKLRYNRIIIMTDADDDGKHIALLLMGLIYKLMPDLIFDKHVYEVKMPLFSGKYKDEVVYAMSESERQAIEDESPNKKFIWQRFKGLGQMNSPELGHYGLNPATRTLQCVSVERSRDAALGIVIESTLGDSSATKWEIIKSMQESDGSFPDWLIEGVDNVDELSDEEEALIDA